MNKAKTGDKVASANGGNKEILGTIVFIGATNKIPKDLLAEVEWFTSKERKPFWIIIESNVDGIRDYDCLDNMASFNEIYKVIREKQYEKV